MFLSKHALCRITALSFLLLLGAGCDPQEDNPAGPGGGDTGGSAGGTQTGLETFEQQALMTFDTVNGVASAVDEIARGDLYALVATLGLPQSPARAQEFVWSQTDGAWILDDSGTESDESGAATWSIWAWIQFRDGAGVPQTEPGPTTAALTIELDFDMFLEAEQDGEVLLMDFVYSDDLEVSGLPDGPFPVAGAGTLSGRMMWSLGGDVIDLTFDTGWNMDLVIPDNDGCPSGTLAVWVDQWEAIATYNGTPTCSWVVKENGTVVDSGAESLVCGAVRAAPPVTVRDRWTQLRP